MKHDLVPTKDPAMESHYPDSLLAHAVNAPSQYTPEFRLLAAEVLRLRPLETLSTDAWQDAWRRTAQLALAKAESAASTDGAALIAAERERQRAVEGWTPEHDDEHDLGQLADAGACYATFASAQARGASPSEFTVDWLIPEGEWPFEAEWWKPSDDPIRNLVRAGALIAAEIDRRQRELAKADKAAARGEDDGDLVELL